MNGHTAAMSDFDFLGPDGGRLAVSFGTGCAAAWAFLRAIVAGSLKARVKELERCREEDNERCERDLERANKRINDLELMLWQHGPAQLRAAMQGVISEQRVELDKIEGKVP